MHCLLIAHLYFCILERGHIFRCCFLGNLVGFCGLIVVVDLDKPCGRCIDLSFLKVCSFVVVRRVFHSQ